MNIKSIVILIFILPISIFCQIDRTRSWYFGEGLKIFFTKDNQLNIKSGLNGVAGEGSSVFNDSVGNLLYYSDWGRLYDSSNTELCKDFYSVVAAGVAVSVRALIVLLAVGPTRSSVASK